MKTYLVGGAVRDLLLGKTPKDKDYVVVGATPAEMEASGYSCVGADFPVFLHPDTGEEYALARREKKTGAGYNGFTCEFGPDVTLEEDLSRRDLTMNAMAMDDFSGQLFDPFNGRASLDTRVMTHVSADAFREDPVRVLRLARFVARMGPDWRLDTETVKTVNQMGKDGVLAELTAERVWKELSRALTEDHPQLFFDTLLMCGVLRDLFPEVDRLCDCTENPKWHPEGNTYSHTMLVLAAASKLNPGDLHAAFHALTHDFGKAAVPAELHPKFHGHEMKGVPMVADFCDRLKVPADLKKHALKVTRFHMHMHRLDELNPKTFVKMFNEMDAFRDTAVVDALMNLGMADARGRLGSHDDDVSDRTRVKDFFDAAAAVKFADLGLAPPPATKVARVQDEFFKKRTAAVAAAKKDN